MHNTFNFHIRDMKIERKIFNKFSFVAIKN